MEKGKKPNKKKQQENSNRRNKVKEKKLHNRAGTPIVK